MANSVDQSDCSFRSSLIWSALFTYAILSDTLVYEILEPYNSHMTFDIEKKILTPKTEYWKWLH